MNPLGLVAPWLGLTLAHCFLTHLAIFYLAPLSANECLGRPCDLTRSSCVNTNAGY